MKTSLRLLSAVGATAYRKIAARSFPRRKRTGLRGSARAALFMGSVFFAGFLPAGAHGSSLLAMEQPFDGLAVSIATETATLGGVNVEDDWFFDAEAGDELSVRVEGESATARMYLRLRDTAGQTLLSVNGAAGAPAEIRNHVFEVPGTYHVRVFSPDEAVAYGLRVIRNRAPLDLEVEPNDTLATATRLLSPVAVAGGYRLRAVGALDRGDTEGDLYALGFLSTGDTVNPSLGLEGSGSLASGDLAVRMLDDTGAPVADFEGEGAESHAIADAGEYFLHVTHANAAGGALEFGGETDVVMLPHTVLDGRENVTVQFWWRTVVGGEQTVISGANAGNDNAFLVFYRNSRLELFSGASSGNNVIWNTGSLSDGRWRHFTVVRNGAENVAELFINGVSQGTRSMSMPVLDIGEGGLMLGQEQDTLGGGLDPNQVLLGTLDEFRIWHRVLSAEEIAANFATHIEGSAEGLGAWWRFDEASGNDVVDSGPWNYTGTLGRVDLTAPTRVASYAPVDFPGGLDAIYLLDVFVGDTLPPAVTGTTLAAAADAPEVLVREVEISFSEELDVARANTVANYELRWAGEDGIFGTADDILYPLAVEPYTGGLAVSLRLTDSALLPGENRLTVTTNLTDRAGQPLAAAYTETVNIEALGLFTQARPGNDGPAAAVPLVYDAPGGFNGSFAWVPEALEATGAVRARAANVRGGTLPDLAVLNRAGAELLVFPNAGDGSFGAPSVYSTESNPIDLAVVDLAGNGREDIIVSNANSHTISVFRSGADGSLTVEVLSTPGNDPYGIAVADLDGDGRPDLAVALRGPNGFAVFLNDGEGGFEDAVFVPSPAGRSNPEGIAAADLDGDGFMDVVLGHRGSNDLTVFWGSAGTFAAEGTADYSETTVLDGFSNPVDVGAGDLTGDGTVDLVAISSGWSNNISFWPNLGGRDFGERRDVAAFRSNGNGLGLRVVDLRGDGVPAVLAMRTSGATVVFGGEAFPAYLQYSGDGQPMSGEAADFSGDGVPDFAVAKSTGDRVDIHRGERMKPLVESPLAGDVRHGFARGALEHVDDEEWWTFEGRRGDRLVFTTETPAASSSGLRYRIYAPDGAQLRNSTASSNGVLHETYTDLPNDGTYYVQVLRNWNYFGEYRFHVMLAPAPWVAERESNNNTGQAQVLPLEIVSPGTRSASVAGKILDADPADFFALGLLVPGVEIQLDLDLPFFTDEFEPVLAIHRADGGLVVEESPGVLSLTHTVADGDGDNYYAVVTGGVKSLTSAYLLTLSLIDNEEPLITADTLPEPDPATTDALVHRFTLTVNKDLDPETVNTPEAWELRSAGPDGEFGTDDDELYTVLPWTDYTSGNTISLFVSDGPPQPGAYRFTAFTSIFDLFGNALETPYVRTFTVEPFGDYIVEGRHNDSFGGATFLGLTEGDFSGSYNPDAELLPVEGTPWRVRAADFDGDGNVDLAVLLRPQNQLAIYFGDGSGGFAAPLYLDTGANPWDLQVADLDGSGLPDLVVSNRNDHTVSVFLTVVGRAFSDATYGLPSGATPCEIVLADLTGANGLDIAVALRGPNAFAVLPNDGNGIMGEAIITNLPEGESNPEAITAADFDGDGFIDVAVGATGSGNVSVFWNHAGAFVPEGVIDWQGVETHALIGGVSSIEAIDLDGDDVPDILGGSSNWSGSAAYLLSGGDRSFAEAASIDLPGNSRVREVRAQAADSAGLGGALIARDAHGVVDFNPVPGVQFTYGGSEISSMAVGDFSGDGIPDLILANRNNNRLEFYRGEARTEWLEDPVTTGMRHIFGRGQLATTSEVDYFKFHGERGERILIAGQPRVGGSGRGLRWRLFSPSGQQLLNYFGATNGDAQSAPFILPATGTYFLSVGTYWNYLDEYQFRVSLAPPPWQAERESNNTLAQGNNNPLEFIVEPGVGPRAHVFGGLLRNDAIDYFSAGNLTAGVDLDFDVALPGFNTADLVVQVHSAEDGLIASFDIESDVQSFTYEVEQSGLHYVAITGEPRGLEAFYTVVVTAVDNVPPEIVATTLPDEGVVTTEVFDRFTLTFSEEMDAATVNELGNYSLVSAGPDGAFGTADDEVYTLALRSDYTAGVEASYWVTDGPLQPGLYRFRAEAALSDLAGNTMTEAFVREFEIANIEGYVLEGRDNFDVTGATALGQTLPTVFDRSFFGVAESFDLGYIANRVHVDDFTGNGLADVLTFNRGAAELRLLPGDGSGDFGVPETLFTGSNGWDAQVADLNGDGSPDIVLSDRDAGAVRVFLNEGGGSFAQTEYAGLQDPRGIAIADLNGDGNPDILAALRGSDGVLILRNNGDGTFAPQVLDGVVPENARPESVGVGDFNGDGQMDIVLGLNNLTDIAVLYGTGADSYSPAVLFEVGFNGMDSIAVADINGDGLDDVVVARSGWSGQIAMMLALPGGDFAEPVSLSPGTGNTYEIRLTDVDGDGFPDLLISRSTGVHVRYGDGETLLPQINYAGAAFSAASGDLDGDGYPDLVVARTSGNLLEIYRGQAFTDLDQPDPETGIRHVFARGRRSSDAETDYFKFSARAGERLMLSTETPGNPSSSGLRYRILLPGSAQSQLSAISVSSNGTGQMSPVDLPVDGTYYVTVSTHWQYLGEYRFRISIAPSDWELESENNNSISQANRLDLPLQPDGTLQSQIMGALIFGDPQDVFGFGNLAAGTQIEASVAMPAFSALEPVLRILDADGTTVQEATGGEGLSYLVPEEAGGNHYVSVSGTPTGIASVYYLEAGLVDLVPPFVVGDTLPEEFTTTDELISSFRIDFSEDMRADILNNPVNYELRSAGADGVFGTFEDVVVPLSASPAYTSGISLHLVPATGVLSPGFYRFTLSGAVEDLAGNAMDDDYVRFFSVRALGDYTNEVEPNDTRAEATPVAQHATHPEMQTGGGRGRLATNADLDYWSFEANAGDRVLLSVDSPDATSGAGLRYRIYDEAGTQLFSQTAPSSGTADFPPLTITEDGTYYILVSINWGYNGEYRLRVNTVPEGIVLEEEPNDSIATATPLPLEALDAPDSFGATAVGIVRQAGDLDYYALGEIPAGSTVFLSTRLPEGSPLLPVVGLYNALNQFQPEVGGGVSSDGVAEVEISQSGEYFALVRASGATHGILSRYIFDVQVAPTGGLTFPNLVPVAFSADAGPFLSGDSVEVSFRIENLGAEATPASGWIDRILLSPAGLPGDPETVTLADIAREGALAPGDGYDVTHTVQIPDGIQGDYYLGVFTDATNLVNEFLFEGDNIRFAEDPVSVTLRDYPDLVIENLSAEDMGGNLFRIQWNTVNRGEASAVGGFTDRIRIRVAPQQTVVYEELFEVTEDLAVDGALARSVDFTAPGGGTYQVEVRTDIANEIFEYNPSGAVAALQNNVANTFFAITRFFEITVAAEPLGAGTVSGGGSYPEGTPVTVEAVPNTTVLPYAFAFWEENGIPRSTAASYTFTPGADRNLIAVFRLPQYFIGANVTPVGAGSVGGTGFYEHNATAVLTANAQPGYLFQQWEDNGSVIGSEASLEIIVTGPRTVTAVFEEANPIHEVTVETNPPGIAVLPGAGTYANGEVLAVTAPAAIESGDSEFLFQRWTLNGQFYSNNAAVEHTFTTLEPFAMAFVAEYSERSLRPTVKSVSGNRGGTIPADFAYVLTVEFDRAMDTAVAPTALLLSGDVAEPPAFGEGGEWISSTRFRLPAVSFGEGQGGTYVLEIGEARDTAGRVMDTSQPFSFVVDVTPPPHPEIVFVESTATTARFEWADYIAPGDLSFFRVYLETEDFTSISGLEPLRSLAKNVRHVVLADLELDTTYYTFVAAVDEAGNVETEVTAVPFVIESELPPGLVPEMTLLTTHEAELDWEFYLTEGSPLGLEGFRVYVETVPYDDVSPLTPIAELEADESGFILGGLLRSEAYYISVVPFNRLGAFDPAVQTVVWSDPLAGILTRDFTFAEGEAVLSQNLIVDGGATLALAPGSRLLFAPGVGLEITDGTLVAEGTPLDPIVFTSAADIPGGTPARGDWEGVWLSGPADASVLRHVWIRYGRGLTVDAGSPDLGTYAAAWNSGAGLHGRGTALLTAENCFLVFNNEGIRIEDTAAATLSGSVLKANTLHNAVNAGVGEANLAGNWWGTDDPAAIAATLSGAVGAGDPLSGEPVLTAAFDTLDGQHVTGLNPLPLRLLSLNAESYRVSEDSAFAGVAFSDVPHAEGASVFYADTPFVIDFPLSPEGGQKNLFLQFRSFSGELSETVSLVVDYVTDGPTITAFNLEEGMVINRPVAVNATATATLGIQYMRFRVNGELVFASSTGSLSETWDIRTLTPGQHRVRLEAADAAGNLAAREFNVVVQPLPPPAPAILSPADGTLVNTPQINISGTAEPGVPVRINRGGAVLGTVTTAPNGQFFLPNATLLEGSNRLLATAVDSVGETASPSVSVVLNTRPPSGLALLPPTYDPAQGTTFLWEYLSTQDRPTRYRLFVHTGDFSDPSAAVFASPLLADMIFVLTSQVADGTYHAAVQGYDAAGNAGPLSERIVFTHDRTAPVLTIAFDRSSPVGPGPLEITLTSNEPLQAIPTLSLRSQGSPDAIAIPLTQQTPTRFSGTFPVSDLSARSGTAQFTATARDLAGNRFSGAPSGPALVFDVTRPNGVIAVSPEAPVQVASPVDVEVTLTLSKPPAPDTEPVLKFFPPVGDEINFTAASGFAAATADRLVWTGTMQLGPENGNGLGNFTLQVTDAVGNEGTAIMAGRELEIYNTALPTPPDRPAGLSAQTLAGGVIRIQWQPVERAETYSIYRAAGDVASPPTDLLVAGIETTVHEDLPPADGIYSYVVTASRRGAEGLPSGILPALSDRTPPPPPGNFSAVLGATGVVISWSAPSEGEVPHRYRVYRNDTSIRTVTQPTTVQDSPPRGVMAYRVASVDPYGNEAFTETVEIELFVGAVTDFSVRAIQGNPPVLQWVRPDAAAVGVHVYRNGVRRTAAPTAALMFVDSLGIGINPVEYSVRAVNAEGQESAPKTVVVHPVGLSVLVNPDGADAERQPLAGFFDSFRVSLRNAATGGDALAVDFIELERSLPDTSTVATGAETVDWSLAAKTSGHQNIVLPAPSVPGPGQLLLARAVREDTAMGNKVLYEASTMVPATVRPDTTVDIALGTQPLAGGLSDFTLTFTNRGYTPVDLLAAREFGQAPGNIALSVQTPEGFEVNRVPFQGVPSGAVLRANGDAVVTLEPGEALSLNLSEVLIPEALGAFDRARFEAIADPIHHAYATARQQVGGPIRGSRTSTLTQTDYYGIAQTDRALYSDEGPILITGQAISRATDDPLPDVPLKIGFASRGHFWFEDVQTDENGDFAYEYTPPAGYSGRLRIWAAHPDVFDQLDQAEVQYLRLYITPGRAEIVMSRSDTIDISLTLINPGDLTLRDFAVTSEAFILDGEDEIPISGLAADFAGAPLAELRPQERRRVAFRVTADIDLPDDPLLVMRVTSAEGATAEFIAQVRLRPSVAILTVSRPEVGYVDVSVDRDQIISREVTVINQGLRPLVDVKMHPPAEIPWFYVNLDVGEDGLIALPDIPVGGTRTFTVVFAPPEDTELGFYSDSLKITGENAQSDFTLNLFAKVTSSLSGGVQFAVDNMFGDRVPNARVRLRNAASRTEVGPFNTDALGEVLIEDLQEGEWSWQVSAAGHATETGVVEVLPDQVAMVSTILSRSLVTVNFTVVPKPFTDRYDIVIEQTFETRVPFPVMVITPPHVEFTNPEPGFETIIMAQVKNEGLIRMIDLEIEGSQADYGDATPLITFLPELGAQEVVDVPFRVRYFGPAGGGVGGTGSIAGIDPQSYGDRFKECLSTLLLPGSLDPDFLRGLAVLANAAAESFSGALVGLAGAVIIGFDIFNFASTWANPLNVVASVIGCAIGSFFSTGPRARGPGGPGGGFGFYGLGCFTEDTPVTLASGDTVPIAEVREGMRLRTDRYGGTDTVSRVLTRESGNLYHLQFSGPRGTGPAELLRGTGEHRIWTDHEGWLALQELQAGHWLHHVDGTLRKVLSVEKQEGVHTVHTLEVTADNAFFAGGIQVQDLCGGAWLPETAALGSEKPAVEQKELRETLIHP